MINAFMHNTVDWVGVKGAAALWLGAYSVQSTRLAAPFTRMERDLIFDP